MAEISVDNFLDLNLANADSGKTIRELFLEWEVPEIGWDGKPMLEEDGTPTSVRSIAFIKPGWGGAIE